MRFSKIENRWKGSIEVFSEDASVAASNASLPVANMVASVVSGTSASILSQDFSSDDDLLDFEVSFSEVGSTTIKVVTTFTGSNETVVSLYKFRTLDDGTGSIALGYQ